jgi:Flp pilus assembly protein TadG
MAVLFTLVLPVLLGAMCLGTDFSIIYFNWAMVQKAADAAALAGASQLTGQSGSAATVKPAAVNYVNGYACLNGVTDSANSYPTLCSPGAARAGYVDNIAFTNVTDTQVQVGIKRSVPYFFGKMIGLQQASVAAKATAAIEPTATVPNGMFPIGLPCKSPCKNLADLLSSLSKLNSSSGKGNVTLGSKFIVNDLWNQLAPGNWGWLDVGQGSGAQQLGTVLQSGSTNTYSLAQTLSTSSGVSKGNAQPAQNGLTARLNACATGIADPCANGGTVPSTLSCNDPCLITIPVVDYTGCSGTSCNMPIEGFAPMYLEQDSTTTSGINVCVVTTNNCTKGEGSASAPNFGSPAPPVLIN